MAGFAAKIRDVAAAAWSSRIILLCAAFVVWIAIDAIWGKPYVGGMSIPKSLIDRGFTESVVERQIRDEADKIVELSKTDMEVHRGRESINGPREYLDIEIGERITIRKMLEILYEFLYIPDHQIKGEITLGGGQIAIALSQGSRTFAEIHEKFVADDDFGPLIMRMTTAIMREVSPYTLGASYFATEDYGAALKVADQMINEQRDLEWAYILQCMAQFQQKSYDMAISSCKKSIALNGSNFSSRANLGNALLQKGIIETNATYKTTPELRHYVEEAVDQYVLAAKLTTGTSFMFCNLSAAYDLLGDSGNARLAQARCPNE